MFKIIPAAVALLAMPVVGNAAQIVLSPASVVGSSGFYTACCNFNPGSILDQQTGSVTESFGAGYWLNPDNGPAAAFITIDLGAVYSLSSISLFNTSNGAYGDRGTGSFQILGGNSVTGGMINAPSVAASGVLAADAPSTTRTAQVFAAAGSFRYISFNPTGVASFNNPCCGANVYGLNELRVEGATVPEPAAWALMIAGFGMVGVAARRRSSVVTA